MRMEQSMVITSNHHVMTFIDFPAFIQYVNKNKNMTTIACSPEKPCHCHGRICLVGSQNCNEGNVFIDGKPICGITGAWRKEDAGKALCDELGFVDVISVTDNGQ